MSPQPHISIKGETLFNVGPMPITNSLVTSVVGTVLFVFIAMYYAKQLNEKHKSRFFYMIQGIIKTLYNLFTSVLGKNVNRYFPLLAAFFFFVIINNWLGLLPGVGSLIVKVHGEFVPLFRSGTADLNTTIALALITVIFTQVQGFKVLGSKGHLGKYANALGGLEAFSELSRILSFSFRLFGNIFAGEVMLTIIAFLLPIFTPPFFMLEVFVGFIQAVVFAMLSAVFINLAVTEAHH